MAIKLHYIITALVGGTAAVAVLPASDGKATRSGLRNLRRLRSAKTIELARLTDARQAEAEFNELVARTVTDLHTVITGEQIATPELATRAATVITSDQKLRNAVLRLGTGHQHAAARTWSDIAALLTGAARADALTVAATHYYLANEPTCVVVALAEADAAASGSDQRTTRTWSRMLGASLVLQLPPDQILASIPTRDAAPIPGTEL